MKIDMHTIGGQLACVMLSGSDLSDFYVFEILESVCALETVPAPVRSFMRDRFAAEDWRLLSAGGIQFGHFTD